MAPLAQQYATKYGYKVCSPCIAQALQESLKSTTANDGLSLLAYKYHNYHGLKCGNAWLKAGKPSICLKTGEEYSPKKITYINDYFRVYSSMAAGVEGYYLFLQADRYKALKQCTDYASYMTAIKAAGYCTSSTYVNNCIDKIVKYSLYLFDNADAKVAQSYPTLKKGDTGEYVVAWQNYLNLYGYDLIVNGIYDNQMYKAVTDYQKKQGIKSDGIIGVCTWSTVK